MRKLLLIIIVILGLASSANSAANQYFDISMHDVFRDFNFRGEKIRFTGLINPKHDIGITIIGPNASYQVDVSEQYLVFWLNKTTYSIKGAPSFYRAYTTNLTKIDGSLDQKEEICRKILVTDDDRKKICNAFIDFKTKRGFYDFNFKTITNQKGSVVFDFEVPQNADSGDYIINVFKENPKGKPILLKKLKFSVKDSGVNYLINIIAKEHPIRYSVFAIFMALMLGCVVSVIMNLRPIRNKLNGGI